MSSILDVINQDGPPLLADGAMGTMLQSAGLPFGAISDTWTLTHPEQVLAVHAAYVAAGSQIVLTNTLNTHPPTISAQEAATLNCAAAHLARQSGARWVAGSLGPGADETQAQALADAGVDIFWLETQLSLDEALRTVAACQQVGDAPIFVTFTFHRPDGLTHTGETATEVAQTLASHGVAALGLNCGNALNGVRDRLEEMSAACTLPLILKPNAGLPRQIENGFVYNLSTSAWVQHVITSIIPQVRLIGGCCGTTPPHINALKHQLCYRS